MGVFFCVVCIVSRTTFFSYRPEGDVFTVMGLESSGFADGPSETAQLDCPTDVAICPDGSVLVCDYNNNRVRKIVSDGSALCTVAGSAIEGHKDGIGNEASFTGPSFVAVDNAGHAVVTECGGHCVPFSPPLFLAAVAARC